MSAFAFSAATMSFDADAGVGRLSGEARVALTALNWWYGVPFSSQFKITGSHDPLGNLAEYLFHRVNFAGKSVLHLGSRDGFFLFLTEALGAREIHGIDDSPASLRLSDSFRSAKEIFGSRSNLLDIKLSQIVDHPVAKHDIVFLNDSLTKTENPRGVLKRACDSCSEQLLITSHILSSPEQFPVLGYYRTYSGSEHFRDLHAPTVSWFQHVLAEEGFVVTEAIGWNSRDAVTLRAEPRARNRPKTSYEDLPTDHGNERETAFLVMSCERYKQAWEPFFTLLFRYWPDCPYSIYLCSDRGRYPDPRIIPIELGEDLGWAKNFRTALERIPASRVILTLEDFLPTATWDTNRIRKFARHAHDYDVGCLRLFACPGPTAPWYATDALGTIGATDPYRISTMNAIWKKSMLIELIRDGMNAWQFELEGSRLAATRTEPFLSVWQKDPCPMSYFATAITKGRWEQAALELLEREGISTDGIRLSV